MSADTADAADTVIEVVDLAGGNPYPFGQGLEQQRSAHHCGTKATAKVLEDI